MISQLTGGNDAATSADPAAGVPARRGPAAVLDRPANRLVLFASVLVVALIGGLGLGRLTSGGPDPAPAGVVDEAAPHTHAPGETDDHDHGSGTGTGTEGAGDGHQHGGASTPGSGDSGAADPAGETPVGGLLVSQAGYRLVPETTTLPVGVRHDFRFQVRDPAGRPVTSFEPVHTKPMHLIVVRRDLTGYQHLHPAMAGDGTWSVPLTLPEPGSWRAYADFVALDAIPTAHELTLGVDLVAAGNFAPRPLPAPARAAAVDGLTVTFEGTPGVGATQPLLFRVLTGDGAPASGLEPYLGAYGHLVVLREGDLGYVHVHPEPKLADGAVKFWLAAPSAGSYRIFFDFQVAGVVRTAEFTLTVA